MATSSLLRHQIIKNLTAQHSENVADAALNLWTQMATQIISIIGESGFDSLYARSVFLTQSTFPWLATGPWLATASPSSSIQRFALLKTSLEQQTPAQASEANHLLLMTFTDILASLIGEPLTTRILRSAWGVDASEKSDKEFKID